MIKNKNNGHRNIPPNVDFMMSLRFLWLSFGFLYSCSNRIILSSYDLSSVSISVLVLPSFSELMAGWRK